MRLSLIASVCLGALVLSGSASAATPRIALFDLRTDLAQASRNAFGDLQVSKSRPGLAERAPGATLVRCAGDCTYGNGWLAFKGEPALTDRDIVSAQAHRFHKVLWAVSVKLSPAGMTRWTAFSRRAARAAKERGVPDALVLAVDGSVAGQPLANQIRRSGRTLEIIALSRSDAARTAKALR
jgi:hypothetical protein